MEFGEKLKRERKRANLTQAALGQLVGVTARSISAYENDRVMPHRKVIRGLARELNVTVEYLTNDAVSDPEADRENETRIDAVREVYGEKGAQEMRDLLQMNTAFLAGGSVDQETKDAFYNAITAAYIACKREASVRFTPHRVRKKAEE